MILIISIVKSSLALSLGLVGALSIVRFRAAIKEPEELVYLFFVISIGLSNGANQFLLSIFFPTTSAIFFPLFEAIDLGDCVNFKASIVALTIL